MILSCFQLRKHIFKHSDQFTKYCCLIKPSEFPIHNRSALNKKLRLCLAEWCPVCTIPAGSICLHRGPNLICEGNLSMIALRHQTELKKNGRLVNSGLSLSSMVVFLLLGADVPVLGYRLFRCRVWWDLNTLHGWFIYSTLSEWTFRRYQAAYSFDERVVVINGGGHNNLLACDCRVRCERPLGSFAWKFVLLRPTRWRHNDFLRVDAALSHARRNKQAGRSVAPIIPTEVSLE